ncbi:hypothetical protein [Rhodopirellula baltica]|uniref:hypothetical protein n=1 Tax=Rhodopirellula baltica TaxID=265606 RepID=UPI0011817DBF|nr:hypothetical protein [Rhodopirellula baltica]
MFRSNKLFVYAIAFAVCSVWASQPRFAVADPPPNPGGLTPTEAAARSQAIDEYYLGAAPALDAASLAISNANSYFVSIESLEPDCNARGIAFPDLTPYEDESDNLNDAMTAATGLANLGDGSVGTGDGETTSSGLRQAAYTLARNQYESSKDGANTVESNAVDLDGELAFIHIGLQQAIWDYDSQF